MFSLFDCGGCVGELALLRNPRKDDDQCLTMLWVSVLCYILGSNSECARSSRCFISYGFCGSRSQAGMLNVVPTLQDDAP